MKVINKASLLMLLSIFLISCGQQEADNQEPEVVDNTWPRAVTYEIFVMSFADSDGDGLGDINGMTSKLDYLQDLGIQGVWLMPIMPSPTYHKYHVTDYKDIDPQYGTMEDFKVFVEEAHKRGIHVITDLVINHCDKDHPWFVEAKKGPKIVDSTGAEVDNPYWNYFVWKTDEEIAELAVIESGKDTDNSQRWHAVEGLDYKYYAYFNGDIPDINFDYEPAKRDIFEIGQWWLTEVDIDGFRLDAAKHIYDFDTDRNPGFWVEFRQAMDSVKSDVYLVGEVWDKAEVVAPYLKGLPASFNFDLGDAIVKSVREEYDTSLVATYKRISQYYNSISDEYIDATFLRNHDQKRVLNEFNGNESKTRVAAAILLTLPGAPYLYYGEEIAMKGEKDHNGVMDIHIREPFLWDYPGTDNENATWLEAAYSVADSITPLSDQVKDPNSVYNFYKELIHLRNELDVLKFGDIQETGLEKGGLISFYRNYGDQKYLVLHNISGSPIEVELPGEPKVVFTSTNIPNISNQVSIKEYATLIIDIN